MKSLLLATLIIAAALIFAFTEEVPVGRIEGTVLLLRTTDRAAGARVVITPTEASGQGGRTRHATAGPDGKFVIPRVVAGVYDVAATTNAHAGSGARVIVAEGRTEIVRIGLTRSQPDLVPTERQRLVRAGEAAEVTVRGYVDAADGSRRLRVRMWKAKLSTLLSNRAAAEALGRIGTPWRDTIPMPPILLRPSLGATPVSLPDPAPRITEADTEGFFVQRLRFGRLPAGLYLLSIGYGKTEVSAWLNVSSLALVLKTGPGEVLAFAADIQSGVPAVGTPIRVFHGGARLLEVRTNAHGVARFPVTARQAELPLMVVAARDNDEAVIERGSYDFEQTGAHRVHVYTDRPIYRPGHEVSYKIIGRRMTGGRLVASPGDNVSLEVLDANGAAIHRARGRANAFGAWHGKFALSPEAPSGSYTMAVSIEGTRATHDLLIASYRKPEFSVTVAADKPRAVHGDTIEVTVRGEYYFGGPLAGAEVQYSVYASPDWAVDYADLDFDEAESEAGRYGGGGYDGAVVAEGRLMLNDNGTATVRVPTAGMAFPESPSQVMVTVQATVTDASGRVVAAESATPLSSSAVRVRARVEGTLQRAGRPIPVDLQVTDLDGKPVAGAPVVVDAAYDEWNADARRAEQLALPRLQAVTDTSGLARVTLTAPREGFVVLTARATDARRREARSAAYVWIVDAGRTSFDVRYGELSIHTDKRRYRPGDTARVLVNSAAVGHHVLLTVEGDRIGAAWTVPIRARGTVVTVPIRAEYGPNVILAATAVRDKKFASAEVPLRVDVPARALRVAVRADRARYTPGDRATYDVTIADADGRPVQAEFSLAVIDEAIYALQEEDPNAMRDAFYPRRYNQVRTTYSFAVRYLGDADKGASAITPRRRFLDTAYWGPVHRTDASGRARVTIVLPDNLTTWRATVIAHTLDTAIGRQTQKSLATKDFFVRVEMPRLLMERDEARILAVVHNNTDAERSATVRLATTGLASSGAEAQNVTVAPGRSAQVSWPVKPTGAGTARVIVTAWTDKGGTRLTDGVELPLPIRPYGRDMVVEVAGDVTGGGSDRRALTLDASAVAAAATLRVRITPSITNGVVGALEYLVDYPYGCVEQTMSRFLPSLLVQKLARAGAPLDPAIAKRIPAIVDDSLTRLYRMRHASGAWGWWEHDDDQPWMTAYVLYGLATAKDLGVPVREEVLESAREAAAKLVMPDPNERLFVWYALALAGDRDTPRRELAGMSHKWSDLGPEGLAYAVLLRKQLGLDTAAPFAELIRRARADAGMLSWRPDGAANSWWRWNWSDRATTAIALRAMLAHDRNDPRSGAVLRWLMRARTGHTWGSTRDTAFALAAIADVLEARGQAARPTGALRVLVNGKVVATVTLRPELLDQPDQILDLPTAALRPGANELAVEHDGDGHVFWTGRFRQTIASDELPAVTAGGIVVQREYLRIAPRRTGQSAWTLQTEPTNNDVRQGDRIVVRVTVETTRDLAYVLLEDLFPSGFETNERGSAEIDEWRYWWTSIDVRDDRVAFFVRELPAGKHVFEYNLRAQTPGRYRAMPAVLSGMYHPEIRGESAAGAVIIR